MKIHLYADPCITPILCIPLLHTVMLYTGKTPQLTLQPVSLADMEASRANQTLQGKPYYVPGVLQSLRTWKLNISQRHIMETLLYIRNAFCMSATNMIRVPGEETKSYIYKRDSRLLT
jgi:hypothetical protein